MRTRRPRWRELLLKWLHGLAAAAIAGGAGALCNIGAVIEAPDRFNLGDGLGALIRSLAVGAAIGAITHGAMYLKQSPLPSPIEPPERQTERPQ